LAGLCDALAKTPLLSRPGLRYEYGFTVEVLGLLCERVAGQPLEEFVRRRLLQPLGMKDTYFVVPEKKRSRMAVMYETWPRCAAAAQSGRGSSSSSSSAYCVKRWNHSKERAPGILSPGGGILSYHDAGMYGTAQDYARFCQMLLDGGRVPGADGQRILRDSTVKLLWRDALAPYAGRGGRIAGWHDSPEPEWAESVLNQRAAGFWDRNSWSLLNSHLVFNDPPRKGHTRAGRTMWMGGGAGAFWVVDTKRRLVAVSMAQCFGGRVVGVADAADKEESSASSSAVASLDCLSRPLGRDITATAIAAYDDCAHAAKQPPRKRARRK